MTALHFGGKAALLRAFFCVAVLCLTFRVSAVALAPVVTPAEPNTRTTAAWNSFSAQDYKTLDDIYRILKEREDAARASPARFAMAATPLADSKQESPSSPVNSATTTTTTTTKLTTTTTSSRVPNPVTTVAPKVAQWTGIAIAIVAVIALVVSLVLCKLKSTQQCCFAPKPHEVTVVSPRSLPSLGSKNPSEDSLSPHISERSFHEAAVDDNVPRRSLLDLNATNSNANSDSDDDSDDDSNDDNYDGVADNTAYTAPHNVNYSSTSMHRNPSWRSNMSMNMSFNNAMMSNMEMQNFAASRAASENGDFTNFRPATSHSLQPASRISNRMDTTMATPTAVSRAAVTPGTRFLPQPASQGQLGWSPLASSSADVKWRAPLSRQVSAQYDVASTLVKSRSGRSTQVRFSN